MLLVDALLAAGMVIWAIYAVRGTSFLPNFGRLLDVHELADGFTERLAGRSFLKGEFRGRQVTVVLRHGNEDESPILVVSMQTDAPPTPGTDNFKAFKGDREGELALFALEVKHEMSLRHMEGCLKAQCYVPSVGLVERVFDPSKWQKVLEAMDTLAGSIEQRGSSVPVTAR
jgi:hypothetical protein